FVDGMINEASAIHTEDDLQPASAEQLVLLAERLAGSNADIHSNEAWLHAMNRTGGTAHVQPGL
ncbi:MAG: hypothetical protein R3308_10790, partial [Thiohalobacterales bacterium]|nr:hypothetical protein [Thiohalobacterales bacterium]